jgi:hypothetical protein
MTLMHVMSYAIHVIASFALKHLMHCTILPFAHIRSFTLGHAEPKFGEPMKQAQAEDLTNLAFDQGKPRCINPCSLYFILNLFFMFHYYCALSL